MANVRLKCGCIVDTATPAIISECDMHDSSAEKFHRDCIGNLTEFESDIVNVLKFYANVNNYMWQRKVNSQMSTQAIGQDGGLKARIMLSRIESVAGEEIPIPDKSKYGIIPKHS